MWIAVTCAAVSAYAAAANDRANSTLGVPNKPVDSLDQMVADHRRRMDRMHAQTMRGARVGTYLLLALVISVGYCVLSLAGLA